MINDFERAAFRLDALAAATEPLGDVEATEIVRDLARVLRDPSYRADWLTEEQLVPIAAALNTDPARTPRTVAVTRAQVEAAKMLIESGHDDPAIRAIAAASAS